MSVDPYRDHKKYHMVDKVRADGSASALCFKSPRPINLNVALWTTQEDAVTCTRCLAKLRERGLN